jgi:hypothetical protein
VHGRRRLVPTQTDAGTRAGTTMTHHHARVLRPMVYIMKGKVSWLRLVAIQVILTASSDAARQARPAAKPKCSSCDELKLLAPASRVGQAGPIGAGGFGSASCQGGAMSRYLPP